MATGTARAGFSGSDFSLQPFRRGPDSASLGPEAPPERRAQLAQNRAGPGKFRARDREGFRQPVSPFILQTREPRPGRQVPDEASCASAEKPGQGPRWPNRPSVRVQARSLTLEDSTCVAVAEPCPTLPGVLSPGGPGAWRVSPKSTGAPCWQELRAATPSRSCPRPAVGTRLQVLSIPGRCTILKEISITRRCFYIDLHFSWGGWDS